MDKRKTEVLRAMLEVAYADGTFDGQEQLAVANILGYLGYTAARQWGKVKGVER